MTCALRTRTAPWIRARPHAPWRAACLLKSAVPVSAFALAHSDAKSYAELVVDNLYAGGDNCGRSIMLGAIAGARFGVGGEKGIPERWIDLLYQKHPEVRELLAALE